MLRLSTVWDQGRGKRTGRSSVTVGFAADKAAFEDHAEELSLSRRFQLGVPLAVMYWAFLRVPGTVVYLALCVCSLTCFLGGSQGFA